MICVFKYAGQVLPNPLGLGYPFLCYVNKMIWGSSLSLPHQKRKRTFITRNDLAWEWTQMNEAAGTVCVPGSPQRAGGRDGLEDSELWGARVWMSWTYRKFQNGSCPAQASQHPVRDPFSRAASEQGGNGCRSRDGAKAEQKYKFKNILIYCRLFPHLCCNSSVLNINKYTFVKKKKKASSDYYFS